VQGFQQGNKLLKNCFEDVVNLQVVIFSVDDSKERMQFYILFPDFQNLVLVSCFIELLFLYDYGHLVLIYDLSSLDEKASCVTCTAGSV
jgi:hypothetical protein